jgi:hypothetical protein
VPQRHTHSCHPGYKSEAPQSRWPAAFLVVGLSLNLLACDRSLTGPSVNVGQEFTLAPGETASLRGRSTSVRFVGVSGDSRCPADAICIQLGDAIVRIEVLSSGGGVTAYDLHTNDLRPVAHGALIIALVQLSPYPFSNRTIQPSEYRAKLQVTE